jgi:hypothetical protein
MSHVGHSRPVPVILLALDARSAPKATWLLRGNELSRRAQAVRKLKNSKRNENDILKLDFKNEQIGGVARP